MATYKNNSVYRNTPINEKYLENYVPPLEPSIADTRSITVSSKYTHRPDLLAYDLYGDAGLWWVFTLYNRDTLKDSMYDLVPGITLIIPKNRNVIGV